MSDRARTVSMLFLAAAAVVVFVYELVIHEPGAYVVLFFAPVGGTLGRRKAWERHFMTAALSLILLVYALTLSGLVTNQGWRPSDWAILVLSTFGLVVHILDRPSTWSRPAPELRTEN